MDARRADLLVALLRGELSSIAHTADAYPAAQDPAAQDPAAPDPAEPTGGAEHGRNGARSGAGLPEHDDHDDGVGRGSCDDATITAELRGGAQDGSAQNNGGPTGGTWCAVCAAQAWRDSRPRLRPVNPGKPLVHVVMAHSTLRGADHAPAELVGYGPICAEAAREIAADAVWRRLVHDADRTHTPPVRPAPAARPPRMRYDWIATDTTATDATADDDPAPF